MVCACYLSVKLLVFLLEQHYGLSLNDMFYQDEQVITQQIEQGTPVISTKNLSSVVHWQEDIIIL
ncbi:hypothetical protein CRM81_14470 [Yersinia kristensenii]|nr:hypothetical protein CRM81_14470 [Yersinia kristensenii]